MGPISSMSKAVYLILFVICACGQISVDNGRQNDVSTFPLTAGTRWEYVQNYIEIPFNDSSAAETTSFVIVRRVIGHEPLIDTLDLTIIDDTTIWSTPESLIYVDRYWYGLDGKLLKEYGYRALTDRGGIEPIFWPAPAKVLDLPLALHKRWMYKQTEFGPLTREVIDTDYFVFEGRSIHSAIVRTVSPIAPRADWIDWYSDVGLLYTHINYGIRTRTDEIGNPIDSAYASEDKHLRSMHIAE